LLIKQILEPQFARKVENDLKKALKLKSSEFVKVESFKAGSTIAESTIYTIDPLDAATITSRIENATDTDLKDVFPTQPVGDVVLSTTSLNQCDFGTDGCDTKTSTCASSNVAPFYKCECKDGYLASSSFVCVGYCEKGADTCNKSTTVCTSTPGVERNYICECKVGYSKVDNDTCALPPTQKPTTKDEDSNTVIIIAVVVCVALLLLILLIAVFLRRQYLRRDDGSVTPDVVDVVAVRQRYSPKVQMKSYDNEGTEEA